MQDNTKVVTIGGKDIVVPANPPEQMSLKLEDELDWFEPGYLPPEYLQPEYLQPGYYYDYDYWTIEGPCHKPLTKKTWLEKCEHLIPPAALKILREVSASSRINSDAEFMETVLQHVGDSVCLKALGWHKHWAKDKSLYYALKQNIETHYLVNKTYRVKCLDEYSPLGFNGCEHCVGLEACQYRDETRVATVKSRSTIRLERYIRYFTAMHPDIEAWGNKFIELLAEDIELEIAFSILARRDTVTYFN